MSRDRYLVHRALSLVLDLMLAIGFLAMPDFIARFGEGGEFSAVRQGTIIGLFTIGTLIGCLFYAAC